MSGTSLGNLQLYNLANLTAPASGITHAVKATVILTAAGTVSFPWSQVMQQAGFNMVPQAMNVDNSGNTVPVTINETAFNWSRTVPAGQIQTFQFPSVLDQAQTFTVTATAAAKVPLAFFDWPAFPDGWGNNPANVPGTTITGTVQATQGAGLVGSPAVWSTTPETYRALSLGNAGQSYGVGGIATPAATPTDLLTWKNSLSNAFLRRITLWGLSTTAGAMVGSVVVRSTANTGGTAAAQKAAIYDGGAVPGSVVDLYSANPTGLGTLFATVRGFFLPFTAAGAAGAPLVIELGNEFSRGIGSNGGASIVAVNLGGNAVPAGGQVSWSMEWTE